MCTLPHTGRTMFWRDCLESLLYFSVGIEASLVDEAVQPASFEVVFYLAEDRFDWVELWAVAYVLDLLEIQLRIGWFDILRSVDLELVHEQGQWLLTKFPSQTAKKIVECISLDCSGAYLVLYDA